MLYYDENGRIGTCDALGTSRENNCQEAKERAGDCVEKELRFIDG